MPEAHTQAMKRPARPTPTASARPASPALELSRARGEMLIRRDQEALSQRDMAEKAKAEKARELIARRKAYNSNGSGRGLGVRHVSRSASPSIASARSCSSSEEMLTRPASPITTTTTTEKQSALPASSEAPPMLGGLFDRLPVGADQPRRSSSGWRCHALAESPRPAAEDQSQQLAAMTEQLAALTACLREEQTARREAEEKLAASEQQVLALSQPAQPRGPPAPRKQAAAARR